MALRIKTNSAALKANQYVKRNSQQVQTDLTQLSSGQRIVSAADGPAALVISEQLRSQVKGLEQVARNTETGIAMIQTTEASLDEVSGILNSLRQLAVHAANDGVNDEIMLQADQNEFMYALDSLDRIANNTSFADKKLLDGSTSTSGATTGDGLIFIRANEKTKESPDKGYRVVLNRTASRSSLVGETALTNEMINQGENLIITKKGKTAEIKTNRGDSVDTIVQKFKQQFLEKNMQLDISHNQGVLSIKSKDYGSESFFSVNSTSAGVLSLSDEEEVNRFRKSNVGLNIAGSINGEVAVGKGQTLEATKGSKNTEGIIVKFMGNDLVQEGRLDEPIEVGSVAISQNSIRLQVGADQDQNVTFSLANVNSTSLGRGIENKSNFTSLRDIDLRNFEGANSAIKLIKDATNEIAQQRGELGAIQKNSLESTLRSVSVAIENTLATESIIRDADSAEVATNLAKNQVVLNTSLAMLAQANQTPKAVLQLINNI